MNLKKTGIHFLIHVSDIPLLSQKSLNLTSAAYENVFIYKVYPQMQAGFLSS